MLFSLGCGRVFEGTMETMQLTLETLANLPGETRVYCGHEYTQANAHFALTVDPANPVLRERAREVDALRRAGEATLPTTIALETRHQSVSARRRPAREGRHGHGGRQPFAVFAAMRERKKNFAA